MILGNEHIIEKESIEYFYDKVQNVLLKYNKVECFGKQKVYVKKIRVLVQEPISNTKDTRNGE